MFINVHYNNTLMKVDFSSTETIMYWKFMSTYPLNLERTHLLVTLGLVYNSECSEDCLPWRFRENFILWKKTEKNWKIPKKGIETFDRIVGIELNAY